MKVYDSRTLALFFTQGVSLRTWEERGYLERESSYYNKLAERLGRVKFFTYGRNDREYAVRMGRIEVVPQKTVNSPRLYSLILPFLQRLALAEVDILKTNQMNGAWTAVVAKMLYGKPLIVRCGYGWMRLAAESNENRLKVSLGSFIESIVFRNADKIFLTSFHEKDCVEKKYGISTEKMVVIPNFVDTDIFCPGSSAEYDENRICFVGRLDRVKNLYSLFDAVRSIDGTTLSVVGEGDEGGALRRKASKEGISVEFRGKIRNDMLPGEYNRGGLFVLPSFSEGNPKALLEAMSCGKAVICSDIPSLREIVTHGYNGFLCGTDASSIEKAIRQVLSDKARMLEMGSNARETIRAKYSLDRVIEREMEVYNIL